MEAFVTAKPRQWLVFKWRKAVEGCVTREGVALSLDNAEKTTQIKTQDGKTCSQRAELWRFSTASAELAKRI
jgi:hypothetical protein